MKKKITISLLTSFIVMFLPLFLTTNYVGGNDGLGVLLLLFFILYPTISLVLGIVSGRNFKKLWFIPCINGIFYLVSTWILLDAFETDFILYTVVYIGIGMISSVITYVVTKKRKEEK